MLLFCCFSFANAQNYNYTNDGGKGKSIAFEDENQWYVINVDKDFKFFIEGVYPDLAKVKVD